MTGKLFVISSPSGCGKGTLIAKLFERHDNIWLSVSATTRNPRAGEVDGMNYYFLDRPDFEHMIDNDELVEWAEYSGNYYGTPKKYIDEHLNKGENVILEIEVQGAMNIKQIYPDSTLIFIEPPSMEELERRLRGRGTEDESTIKKRMQTAEIELLQAENYDYIVVNDSLDDASRELEQIIFKN